MDMYFFKNLFPGDSPKINDVRGNPWISTVEVAEKDAAKYLDEPVFLATPLEPPIWGRWVANVMPRIHHYLTYGQGRKFLCHAEKPWQRATLISLGVPEDSIVHHEPGCTYLCQDIMAVENSGPVLPLSLSDRAMMNNLVQRHRVRSPFGKKLFVSRVTQTKKNPNYRPLLNEAELIDLMKQKGFDIIEPELISLPEQMSAFREAQMVVFVGGSSLFNTAFCEPGTRVVTIEASTTFISTHMEYLSALEVDYGVVFGREDPEDNRPRHRRWTVDAQSVWNAIEPMIRD